MDREARQIGLPDETVRVMLEREYTIHSYDQIMREPLLPVEWLVEPLLVKSDRAVLYGAFGSFKSWLLLDIAIHLAAGCDWLGFPVARPLRVLYIDEEMNERTLRRRLKRLGMGTGIESTEGRLRTMSRQGIFFDESGANKLLTIVKSASLAPDVIIVEALRRVLVGSENKAEDIAQFWRNVEPLQRAGITVVISHHFKKPQADGPGSDTRHQASGSTDILAGADAGFGVRPCGEKDDILVECVKLRDAEIARPFGVRFIEHSKDGPVEMRPVVGAALSATDEQALAHINALLDAAPTVKSGEIEACLKEKMALARRTVYDVLSRLERAGHLRQPKHGAWARPESADVQVVL